MTAAWCDVLCAVAVAAVAGIWTRVRRGTALRAGEQRERWRERTGDHRVGQRRAHVPLAPWRDGAGGGGRVVARPRPRVRYAVPDPLGGRIYRFCADCTAEIPVGCETDASGECTYSATLANGQQLVYNNAQTVAAMGLMNDVLNAWALAGASSAASAAAGIGASPSTSLGAAASLVASAASLDAYSGAILAWAPGTLRHAMRGGCPHGERRLPQYGACRGGRIHTRCRRRRPTRATWWRSSRRCSSCRSRPPARPR